ncbi:MAG: polyvinyl alcohol dehydrogenase (cytochrome) [Limisphaerales bacterium]|jgi:polyvinyl alcohol dehydrogenase (cytochrome)
MRADDHPATTITGPPTAYQNRLFVPVSSLEVLSASSDAYECFNFRGSVLALDLHSGSPLWQTYMVSEPEAQQKNVMGIQNYGPSGAPIWNSPTIDTEREQLYVGTGENYSSPATTTSDAILALSLDTGNIRWVYQATLGDAWNTACGWQKRANCPEEDGPDFDFGASVVLATDSQGRDFVLGPQKSGAIHANPGLFAINLSDGGSMDGGTAPLPFGGRLYVNSGYNFARHMAGNVMLVYGPK